jgi:hypothetical protein
VEEETKLSYDVNEEGHNDCQDQNEAAGHDGGDPEPRTMLVFLCPHNMWQ